MIIVYTCNVGAAASDSINPEAEISVYSAELSNMVTLKIRNRSRNLNLAPKPLI